MRELAPKPTPGQFAAIANAIAPAAEVISTRQLRGGTSCRMGVLEFATSPWVVREVVVRQYALWHRNENPHPGVFESAALKLLDENSVPAPRLVLDEQIATEILGQPAIITSVVGGKPNVNPVDRENWVGQLVESIARVHEIPISAKVRSLIPSQYDRYDSLFSLNEPPRYIAQHPLGTKLWSRLGQLWPSIEKSGHQLIHADYWSGNTLWNNENLAAIIDWEQPRIGEPTFDVADLVQDASCFGIDIEQSVISQYEGASDRPLRDYKFWRMAVALGEMGDMPNPVEWAFGFVDMGGVPITPAEIGANHAATIERMLAGA